MWRRERGGGEGELVSRGFSVGHTGHPRLEEWAEPLRDPTTSARANVFLETCAASFYYITNIGSGEGFDFTCAQWSAPIPW
jgi:hypothetical protein